MGYLDNSSITVDAILTKKGRELLSRGNFNITSFALGDDEIDYSLFNENHPNGSQYAGEAIENMPILEAFPDENNIMRHKLITLPRDTTKIPILALGVDKFNLNKSEPASLTPKTINYEGNSSLQSEPGGYIFTVKDARLLPSFGNGNGSSTINSYNNAVAFSQTVSGLQTLNFTSLSSTSLFGSNDQLTTLITVEGVNTGARATIQVTINKNTIATGQYNPAEVNSTL
jgi:hypothetical protein